MRVSPRERATARRAALQAVYQWQVSGGDAGEVITEFRQEGRLKGADQAYFVRLVRGVVGDAPSLDAALGKLLTDREVEEVDQVARALLRVGAYELRDCPETPWRVVINEAVRLAHEFGSEASHRYVNAVLDRLAQTWRGTEIAADPKRSRD
ncbi:MAG: transcription antitermination factor NusB [Ectothiorhodospiraceae bacterium]|nr:transcription antitermination factor NusB [Chromatiales bacterium]MCP5156937.1 transcription antitermination factor NusB [Ectothiorhodospiraceae bacterium]